MKIALYGRVSSHRQEKEETVATQIDYLQRWASLNAAEIVATYIDEAVSGTVPVPDRPDGARLLADLRQPAFDALVVYRIDRLGRSPLVIHSAVDRLEKANVAFISATEGFDTSQPIGRMMLGLIALFAQFERDAIAQRCTDGKYKAARRGTWPGGREKFGYALHDRRLVENPETAAVVRALFTAFGVDRLHLARLAHTFTERGIPTPAQHRGEARGHARRWHATTIRDILTDPAYKGAASWSGVEIPVPALVPAALWDLAQQLLADPERQGWQRGAGQGYLLTGLIRCGTCGKNYQGTRWKNGNRLKVGHVYGCRGKIDYCHSGQPRCPSPWLPGAIEEEILTDCRRMLDNPRVLSDLLREQQQGDIAHAERLRQEKYDLQRERSTLPDQRARTLRLYRQDEITEDEWRADKAEIDQQEARLGERIHTLALRLASLEDARAHLAQVETLLVRLRERSLPEAEMVRSLVHSIEVTAAGDGRPRVLVQYWPAESGAASSLSGSRADTVCPWRACVPYAIAA